MGRTASSALCIPSQKLPLHAASAELDGPKRVGVLIIEVFQRLTGFEKGPPDLGGLDALR